MNDRANALADQFEKANSDFISMLEGLSDEQWNNTLDGEGWPVGVGACHIAEHHLNIAQLVQVAAKGEPVPDWAPKSMQDLDRLDADIAARHAGCSREEAMDLLRTNAAKAAQQLRGLRDEQLNGKVALPAMGSELSAEQIAQMMMVGHIGMHTSSFQQAAAKA